MKGSLSIRMWRALLRHITTLLLAKILECSLAPVCLGDMGFWEGSAAERASVVLQAAPDSPAFDTVEL